VTVDAPAEALIRCHGSQHPQAVTLSGPSRGEARVATSGTCAGPGRVDVSLGMATQVLLFQFRGPIGVLPKGVRRAVQERVVTRAVEMLQLANQVGLGKILRTHTRHVVLLLWPCKV